MIGYHGSRDCLRRFAPVWGISLALAATAPGVAKAVLTSHAGGDSYAVSHVGSLDLAGGPPIMYAVEPFVLGERSAAEREQAVGCLTEAIYYEAGFEPASGQRAVAQVVLNRVRDLNFPATICGVVYQGWERATGCQFSFVCDGSRLRRPPQPGQWARARRIAERALDGHVEVEVGTATHYHTEAVRPSWRSTLVEITQVGEHVFYRWPGRAGLPTAMRDRYAGGEFDY